MQTVAFLNQRGGVGKSSSVFHLSATLAEMGRRVLLVDMDPQSSLTQGFYGPAVTFGLDPNTTVAAILAGDCPFPAIAIRPTGIPGVDIVPGSESAARWNRPEPHLAEPGDQTALASFLEEAGSGYDLALIDCSPTLYQSSWNSLVAADAVVIPSQPEDFGAQGLAAVRRMIASVQAGPNPRIVLAGFLLTMVKRINVHHDFERMLRSKYGGLVFDASIPESTAFKDAVTARQPIATVRPKKTAPAKAIKDVAAELLSRLAGTYTVAEVA